MKSKRSELHISVSDKGGEFVVMRSSGQKQLTTHHVTTNTGVYKYIPPTRKQDGVLKPIARPTDISFHRQIKSTINMLEDKCNTLRTKISAHRNLGPEMCEFYKTHNTQLPTLYVLIMTHNFNFAEMREL